MINAECILQKEGTSHTKISQTHSLQSFGVDTSKSSCFLHLKEWFFGLTLKFGPTDFPSHLSTAMWYFIVLSRSNHIMFLASWALWGIKQNHALSGKIMQPFLCRHMGDFRHSVRKDTPRVLTVKVGLLEDSPDLLQEV